jgi:hypothetical protein
MAAQTKVANSEANKIDTEAENIETQTGINTMIVLLILDEL